MASLAQAEITCHYLSKQLTEMLDRETLVKRTKFLEQVAHLSVG